MKTIIFETTRNVIGAICVGLMFIYGAEYTLEGDKFVADYSIWWYIGIVASIISLISISIRSNKTKRKFKFYGATIFSIKDERDLHMSRISSQITLTVLMIVIMLFMGLLAVFRMLGIAENMEINFYQLSMWLLVAIIIIAHITLAVSWFIAEKKM